MSHLLATTCSLVAFFHTPVLHADGSLKSILLSIEKQDQLMDCFEAEYTYECKAGKDAKAHLLARRIMARTHRGETAVEDKDVRDQEIAKLMAYRFNLWHCYLLKNGRQFVFRTQGQNPSFAPLTNYSDGSDFFFEGRKPNRFFLLPKPIIRQPRIDDIFTKGIWSFGISHSEPFQYSELRLVDVIKGAIASSAISLTTKNEGLFELRFGVPRSDETERVPAFELQLRMNKGRVEIARVSSFFVARDHLGSLGSTQINESSKVSVSFSDFIEVNHEVSVPRLIRAEFWVRMDDLGDYNESYDYEFVDGFDPKQRLHVSTHEMRISSISPKAADISVNEFRPKFDKNSSIYSYLLDRDVTIQEATAKW